ncbi:hypothetical protein V6N12_069459 [Hibiscus sabdariffa]|uniref:AAA+ ATPase domain-containing protein n=1 Tax=Hibiscus sabdariffa TaxID=183260 RepID=A0ABR2FED3_9ROSI
MAIVSDRHCLEFRLWGMADIGLSVASKVAEYLVLPAIRHLGYMFRFASNIEDLRQETEKLIVSQGRLQNDVNEAVRQTEEIEEDVQDWLMEANKVLQDVRILETEIDENRRCFNWCPNLHWRYQLSKKVAKKKLIVVKLRETSIFQRVGHRSMLPVIEFLPSKDFMPSKSSEKAFNQIMESLKDDDVSMIGLYGMAGVGKTTLVKEVAKKVKAMKLFDQVVIAVVSQTPSIRNIQGRIGDLLDLQFGRETEEGRAAQLWHRLQEPKKILVILDDVWKELNLADIGIPFGDNHKGCKVLLTTRLQHVCSRMGSQKKIRLDVLPDDEAWTLFKHNACLNDVSCYGELDDVAQEVARECKGLPLAIVTIAKALREKDLDEWIVANQQLKSSQLVENQDFWEDIYGCLKFSYDYLKGTKIKPCFLLCSHFPEDYEIGLEVLTRYAIGKGIFDGVGFIEDARRETRVLLTNLQHAGLLLDTGYADTVKMHDVVRDFAHWIASEGENGLMIKAGLGLKQWPHSKSLQCCTTISLFGNDIGHLPKDLDCPKLETLLLSGNYLGELPGSSFKGMKSLKVLTLSVGITSFEGLQFLTNLRNLSLVESKLGDISPLGKLKALEILDFGGCYLKRVPDELGDLNGLRLLDLSYSSGSWTIPPNLIRRLSKLEELYIGDFSFSEWAIQGTGEEATTASISELASLSRLTALTMKANSICIPKDFVFPKLQRYKIAINQCFNYRYPSSRSLKITEYPLTAFKELFCNIEYLDLDTIGGPRHLVPSLDPRGLNNLTFLRLRLFRGLECLIHTEEQQVPTIALVNLVELFMEEMMSFEKLCNGLHPSGFLHKLEKFTAEGCAAMVSTVPVVKGLKEATVVNCPKLLAVFQLDNVLHNEQENHAFLLSNLISLKLDRLPNLMCIWEGPIDRVSLQSLKSVTIGSCSKLPSLFSSVLAQGLLQLETLEIHDCPILKYVIEETADTGSYPLRLPKLTTLKISSCDSLEYVFPITMVPDLPRLKEINITNCTRLKRIFILGKEIDGKDIFLPQLRSLVLKNLRSLSTFSPPNCVIMQSPLEMLEVAECPLLELFTFQNMRAQIKTLRLSEVGNNCPPGNGVSFQGRHRATGMEYLTVGNCAQLFQLEEGFLVSGLEKLHLTNMQELRVIWKGPKQIAILQNLSHLEIVGCKRLRHLFTPMCSPNFLQLKELTLKGCDGLEQIIVKDQSSVSSSNGHPQQIRFPNVTKIWIKNCNKLKCVFPLSGARSLLKLEELRVEGSSELKHVFGLEYETSTVTEEDMVLPNLKRLELLQLPSLDRFSPLGYHFMFPSWSVAAVVKDCPAMTMCFTVNVSNLMEARTQKLSLQDGKEKGQLSKTQGKHCLNFEDVKLNNCGVEEVFQLKGLPLPLPLPTTSQELKCYCSIPYKDRYEFYDNVCLKYLTTLELSNCKRLKHIFQPTLARNLPHLKYLRIWECDELEQIVAKDDSNERDHQISSSKAHVPPTCFCSLHEIKIRNCNKLKSLFHVSVTVPRLEKIMVDGSSGFEHVFFEEKEDEVQEEKTKVLPMLWMCDLIRLPRLNTFCPKGYDFVIPYLSCLNVKDCPKLPMTFSIDSDHSVHARAEGFTANCVMKEDEAKGTATMEQVDTGNDVDWKRWRQSDRNKLALYEQES